MTEVWIKQLFKQKSLWDVYTISADCLPRSSSNNFWFWFVSISNFVLTSTVYGLLDFGNKINYSASLAHEVAGIIFLLSVGVLGFLIAGFSIFSTISKPDLFIMLAKIPFSIDDQSTDLNQLQYILFNFINVFSHYVVGLIVAIFIMVGFSQGSAFSVMSYRIEEYCPESIVFMNIIAYSLLVSLLIEALLRLKTFIWNLYQAVLITITIGEIHQAE